MFLNSVTKVSLKIREDIGCDGTGTGLKISLANDDHDPCYTATKSKFNDGDLLEWKFGDLGNCRSASMTLKSTKVTIIPSDSATNFCPEYLTVRIDDNLFTASYEAGLQTFQFDQQQKYLTGNKSF